MNTMTFKEAKTHYNNFCLTVNKMRRQSQEAKNYLERTLPPLTPSKEVYEKIWDFLYRVKQITYDELRDILLLSCFKPSTVTDDNIQRILYNIHQEGIIEFWYRDKTGEITVDDDGGMHYFEHKDEGGYIQIHPIFQQDIETLVFKEWLSEEEQNWIRIKNEISGG